MIKKVLKKLVFICTLLLSLQIIITSCTDKEQLANSNGGFSDKLWDMVVSEKLPEVEIVIAKMKNTPVLFKDKSLGKPLTKPPEVLGG